MAATNGPPAGQRDDDQIGGLARFNLSGAEWLARQRALLTLAVPACLYVTLMAGTLLGSVGIVFGILASLAIVTLGPRVKADTLLSLYRAEPLSPGQGAALREAVGRISARAELSHPPAIAIIPSLAVGAFACGSGNRRALLVTEGLLRRHDLPEIVALAAHEIAHDRLGHLPLFSIADTTTRVAQGLFYLGLVLLGFDGLMWLIGEDRVSWLTIAALLAAPTLSSQLQLRLHRGHDLEADLYAARLLGDRTRLARLAAAEACSCGSPIDDIRLPVPQRRVPLPSPLRCHLDGPRRAEQLLTAGGDGSYPAIEVPDVPLVSLVGLGPGEMRPRDRWPGLWF